MNVIRGLVFFEMCYVSYIVTHNLVYKTQFLPVSYGGEESLEASKSS